MQFIDTSNPVFSLAFDFVNSTSRSVFLTGKAGTGKTTFLKFVREKSDKNLVVAAPTGVAAINAGGMTLHSIFQLPLGVFLPGFVPYNGSVQVTNRNSLISNLRLFESKRALLRELELLIIDEVSMVRCDMLDATDTILRHVRRKNIPFGGVQVLFIGDLFQLPPVAQSEEWSLLKQHYESPFFFHAKVMQQAPPLSIELNKIFRQNEQEFIDLLNHIRNNEIGDSDINLLNSRYANAVSDKDCVTLTTHNYKADAINRAELQKLPGKLFTFDAVIEDEFADRNFPADRTLQLKQGARVMFIRNDTGEDRQYYNGKLATVTELEESSITVQFAEGGTFKLKRESWKNIRYQYNADADEIMEETLGSFAQYPIRLAWAITIHKSQGLTFQKAIIDASESFEAGQVYVALSRCTSLQGLILKSRIGRAQIATNPIVQAYSQNLQSELELQDLLNRERDLHLQQRFVTLFDFTKLHSALNNWMEGIPGRKLPDIQQAVAFSKRIMEKSDELLNVSGKFQKKLEEWFSEANGNYDRISSRSKDAIQYFNTFLHDEFFSKLIEHMESFKAKKKAKKYIKQVKDLASAVAAKGKKMREAKWQGEPLYVSNEETFKTMKEPVSKSVQKKGSSALESLTLFKQGLSIPEIADSRSLAISTIEGHLIEFIKTGEVEIEKIVPPEKVKIIAAAIQELNTTTLSTVKQKLGDGYSYAEIRAVMDLETSRKVQV